MKYSCDTIYDLLPLYVDGICSEDSKGMVEKHLAECKECQQNYEVIKKSVAVEQDHQGATIKRIKKRILIEKIVVVAVIVFVLAMATVISGVHCLTKLVPMKAVDAATELATETDENGNVWLIRAGVATEAKLIFLEQSNTNGEIIAQWNPATLNTDVDNSHVIGNVVLCETLFDQWRNELLGESSIISEERSILFNTEEKPNIEKIVVTNIETGEELVLWEK